jgi:hypothetical protein
MPQTSVATPNRHDRMPKASMNFRRLSVAKVVTGPAAARVSAIGTSPGFPAAVLAWRTGQGDGTAGHGRDDADVAEGRLWVVARMFLLFPLPLFAWM